jgi:excisionase family DNA binding protein
MMNRIEFVKSGVLTVPEVSKYLRVHPSTVYRLLKSNQLKAFRVGGDWRFTVESIDQWLQQRSHSDSLPPAATRQARPEKTP